MPSAPFSRLQLAAALIEYDNDQEDQSKPRRNAQESAIFMPFRNRPIRGPPPPERRSTDYLGVSLPNETGSVTGRESVAFDRKSRASIDGLRNPFGRDSTYDGGIEEEDEEEDLEVDLASWGLDALVDKDKEKAKRKRVRSEALPNPHDGPSRNARPMHTRARSANMLNGLGEGGAFLDSQSTTPAPLGARRHSIGDPLNLPAAYSDEPIFPQRSRSPSAHALIDNIPSTAPLHSVPFPTSESIRSPSPQADYRRRTLSVGSMSKILEQAQPEDDNPFAVRPPSPSRMSRFDPKAQRARTMSQGTLATQMMLDYETPEPEERVARLPARERRLSRMELMRPKVLIMPSPLQSAPDTGSMEPGVRATEGFELSVEGRPLPPGARAARRSSVTLSVLDPGLPAPVASNSFTPNPRSSLTLSQLTFRNTLMVDGQRDVAYADIDAHLRRATEEGQQIEEEREPEPEVPIVQEEPTGPKRPAGKLYGRSLIDDIEARKAEMRGKQRVFRGDDRPSMMARSQVQRSSTLITPDELKRPTSQHLNSFHSQPDLTRRNSANVKPLLDFAEEIPGAPRGSLHPGGAPSGPTRSVFGVDTLWERELSKLKIIEEQERVTEEERKKREFEEEAKNAKKRGKRKGKDKDIGTSTPTLDASENPSPPLPQDSLSSAPPKLPAIPKTIVRRAPPPPGDDDDDSDEDSDVSDAPARPRAQAQASGWHSDEDEGPRRTTGTGMRYPSAPSGGPPRLPQIGRPDDDSSEEDVPLVAIGRAAQRQTRSRLGADDDSSDEDKPLTALLDKKGKLPSVSSHGGGGLSPRPAADEDEDDKPLGLRVSRFGGSLNASLSGGMDGDEDDKPLGLHPDQLRKSQFMMAAAAQQQQQQQQMFAQAQMAQMSQMAAAHQSMMFGAPSMMGSGFFAPQMTGMTAPPMMMYPPQLPPTPPPIQDAAKFGRVDKWRHDVAVEGEQS